MKQFLTEFQFDVLVIGGGITGAGIALDAVTRGLSVALIDMQDFAAGTSSRSTKLIHGGLRYLKQLEVKIVAETGREREIVYRNALHVTEPERMLLPFHKGGTFGKHTTSLGLLAYDMLAGVKKDERREMISAEETIAMEPLIKKEDLLGGGHYVEYRTDDARLTIEVLKKAVEKGALCLNYLKASSFMYNDEGQITGAKVKDVLHGEDLSIQAHVVVNATGPWIDEVRSKDIVSNAKRLRLTKGIHIVVDRAHFPLQQAVYFDTQDDRMIFAIPRGHKAYIGTTDTVFEGDTSHPVATEEDIDYVLRAVRYMFPSVEVKRQHVESTWAGIRPLIYEDGKKPSEISRKDEIWEAKTGLITIAGGKLTGYRKMAQTVVDQVVKQLPHDGAGPCVTEHIQLSGGNFQDEAHYHSFIRSKSKEAELFGISQEEGMRLATFYGTNVDTVFVYAQAFKTTEPIHLAIMKAEVFYAIHHEMATSPADFFIRRTGDLYFQMNLVKQYRTKVTDWMSQFLSYTEDERHAYLHELDGYIADAEVRKEVLL